jgi:hypothetical protein
MEVQRDTGRKYASGPQIIQARTQADGSILFVDISRGIDGVIAKPSIKVDSELILKVVVMRAYDSRQYVSSHGAWMQLLQPEKAS